MSAHFWLSKEAIPLTLDELSSMSDDQARRFLAEMRWGGADKQVCPDCGVVDSHYDIRTRKHALQALLTNFLGYDQHTFR